MRLHKMLYLNQYKYQYKYCNLKFIKAPITIEQFLNHLLF